MNDAVQTYRLISLTSPQHTHLLQLGPAGVYDVKPAVWEQTGAFEEVKAQGTVDLRQDICTPAHNFNMYDQLECVVKVTKKN